MSRNKGTFNFSANFEPLLRAPLDARSVVTSYEDLLNPSTWIDSEGLEWLYNGLIVGVASDPSKGIYLLIDSANYTTPEAWEKAGTSDVSVGVINVGDGSAAVFVGHDSSGNIMLRTLSGAGAAIVSEIGNKIVISLDASFAGEINYGINIANGEADASIYYGKDGDALLFRGFKAGQGISITQDASLITIDVSGGGILDGSILASQVIYDPSTLDPSLAMPYDVGGIPAGTTVYDLNGDNLTTILMDLLFPTANPTLTAPSATFTITPSTLQEVGATVDISALATFNQGSINPQYSASSPYRSGLPHTYDYAGFGLVDVSSSNLSNAQNITGYTVIQGNQTNWSSAVSFEEGVQPKNNKGGDYDAPYPAGSTTVINRTFEGVYPLFATTVNINTLTKQSLVSMISGNNIQISLVAESGGNKQKFEIPDAWIGSRPLVGVQQYNTVSGQWEYPGGSAAQSLLLWTTSSVQETIQGNAINYTQYTYNGTDRSNVLIRLVF